MLVGYYSCLVYGNVDITVHKSTSVSKTMFPAHVSELHNNRDEGFEKEFEVRMCIHCMYCVQSKMHLALAMWASCINRVAYLFISSGTLLRCWL